MEDISLIVDLVIALGIALVGGLAARRLGLPVLVGYILAGVVIGPQTPGIVAHGERVELMANVGVAFLMFALGAEFSLAQLRSVGKIASTAGAVQMPLSILLGVGVGRALGWNPQAAVLLGFAFMACSSIVVIKLTLGTGEATSPPATAALGLGVLQDLTMIPLLALLPLLESTSGSGDLLLSLVKSLGAAAIALILVVVLGTRLVPRLFYFVSRSGTRELFLLTILMVALGTAYAAHQVGISFALGAFLAGLVVSESEFDVHVLSEIIPLRDVFSTLFFVSLGMLIEPHLFIEHPVMIGAVILVLVLGKFMASLAGFLVSGLGEAVATRAAILTSQVGEFSFLLASIGLSHRILDEDQFSLILSVAIGSILISPLALKATPRLTQYVGRLPIVRNRGLADIDSDASYEQVSDHVVICGYGRVGMALATTLIRRNLEFTVIEMNPAIVRDLQAQGIPALYGDSTGEHVLQRAGVERARVIAVTVPNTMTAVQTVKLAKQLNPRAHAVARAARALELPELRSAGASEIVQPEFEAGLEFLRHVLRIQDVAEYEIDELVERRRHKFYQQDDPTLALVVMDEQP